jgi:hypothetical protein
MRAGIEDVDAVVSTVGGGVADARADGIGNINLVSGSVAAVLPVALWRAAGTGVAPAAAGLLDGGSTGGGRRVGREGRAAAAGAAPDARLLLLPPTTPSALQIEAAAKKGVKKFVLVTSIGCGSSKDAPGEKVRGSCAAAASGAPACGARAALLRQPPAGARAAGATSANSHLNCWRRHMGRGCRCMLPWSQC